jgi:hypothetical protein
MLALIAAPVQYVRPRIRSYGCNEDFSDSSADDCFRRISLVAVRLGEGPLTEQTAGVEPLRREQVFMSHTCRSNTPSAPAKLGDGVDAPDGICVPR